MKILYVITGLAQGGAERVVCDLADSMIDQGHEVKIAYLTGEVFTAPKYESIEIIKINLNRAIDLPSSYLRLGKLIKNYNPDIVHSHMVHANILTRLVRLVTPMSNLICTAHSNNEGGHLRMFMYRVTHNLADLSTNVSKGAVKSFEEKHATPKAGMKAIYNGIDINKYTFMSDAKESVFKEFNLSLDYKMILAVGRLHDQKDYPNLLQAIELLKRESDIPFKLIVAGDGDQRERIEKHINELGLQSEVFLLGQRNDIPRLMSAADVFVLSSKNEGFGLVVAEAMACQCLVVATDCGGVDEVINRKGILVQKENYEALSKGLSQALKLNLEYKKKLVNNAREHVHNVFNLKNIAKKWDAIYEELSSD